MKLYTEEQINELMVQLQKAFLPENIECDGAFCMGCWKDVVRETLKSMTNLTPIELPTEEEIAENAYIWCQVPDERGYINSGDDYDNHELPAFIAGAQWVVNLVKQQDND